MAIPYQQSYNEPKWQECYERFVGIDGRGESQKRLAAALGLPERTIAWRCSRDGWQAEREARRAAVESGDLAALAVAVEATDSFAVNEIVAESVDDVLRRQQRVAQMLSVALEEDVEREILKAVSAGKPLARGQISQLAMVANNIHSLERKAHRLPDKIETKDTTPSAAEKLRGMNDDQLDRREQELDRQLAEAEGRAPADQAGEAAPPSVN